MSLFLLLACADPGPATDSAHTDGADSADTAGLRDGRYFPDDAPWYTDATDAAVDATSAMVIGALQEAGWGLGRFQMDFSLEVLTADADTPTRDFAPSGDFYSPDCDQLPVPLPTDGNIEGETGYACTSGGDCHLLVADPDAGTLYEMWRADIEGDTFSGGCLAAWDMTRSYGPEGRGDQCTSADAAGYPITPLLFTADEVAAGHIDHAVRFALPNESIRDGEFFHPATHATNAGGGGAEAVPYGAHLRLKPDFDTSRITDPEALVVVRALQSYGMFLADGGSVTLMGAADTRSTAKWADLFDTHALVGIEPDDFELLALDGPAIPLTFDCVRAE
jgi:serine/threonine-protein kinase